MIRVDNTQRRLFEGRLADAIARDRAAMDAEEIETHQAEEFDESAEDEQPWQLWLAIALGSMLIIAAAII